MLSEEIILRCLSFLSAHELATVSRVSWAWSRLAHDPQVGFAEAVQRRSTDNVHLTVMEAFISINILLPLVPYDPFTPCQVSTMASSV